MEHSEIANLILHKWKVELKSKPKSKSYVAQNFDELVDQLKSADIPRSISLDIMKEAIPEHFPSRSLARSMYKKYKYMAKDKNEDEYYEEWCSMIEAEAYQVFYLYYPLEDITGVKDKKRVDYGSMSKQEYMRQMAYATSHPDVDMDKIREHRERLLRAERELMEVRDNDHTIE